MLTPDDIERAAAFLRDPDAEDCESFASRYGSALIEMARGYLRLSGAAAFAKTAHETLIDYEADYGEPLPDDHEIGRIDDSRSSPSFRVRVGHIRRLAAALSTPTGETP